MLVVGLAQGKQKLWLPGAVGMFLALMSALYGVLSFATQVKNKFQSEFRKEMKQNKNSYYGDYADAYDYTESAQTIETEINHKDFFDKPVSANIVSNDGNSYTVDFFPAKILADYGIEMEGIVIPEERDKNINLITLRFRLKKDVTGRIEMAAYNYNSRNLVTKAVEITGKSGQSVNLDFSFLNSISFSDIDYFELSFLRDI